jgi:hypothetical protein
MDVRWKNWDDMTLAERLEWLRRESTTSLDLHIIAHRRLNEQEASIAELIRRLDRIEQQRSFKP